MLALKSRRAKLLATTLGPVAVIASVLAAASPKKHRWSLLSLVVQSILASCRSIHLRNMLISSLLLSYVISRRTRATIGLPLSFGTLYLLYYHFSVRENAEVHCQGSYWNTLLVEKSGLARQTFSPTLWGINRHAQTISLPVVSLVEWLWSKPVRYIRENVRGWDNNDQHLDWVDEVPKGVSNRVPGSHTDESQPIIVLLHGIGDDRFHPAIMRMARLCRNRGWRVVVWSYWRFDFSESRDIQLILDHIANRCPVSPLVAMGWSAGGHLLLNYLGNVGKSSPLVCAVAVSPATDFDRHGRVIQEEESNLYFKYMGIQSHKCLRRHVNSDKRIKDPNVFLKKFSLFELDGGQVYGKFLASSPSDDSLLRQGSAGSQNSLRQLAATAKTVTPSFSTRRRNSLDAAGLPNQVAADTRQLVQQATGLWANYPTAAQAIDGIQIPTLIISSKDDPVTPLDDATADRIKKNRHCIFAETLRGGHIGFYDGLLPFGSTWDARSAASYIGAVLESLSQTNYMLNILKEAIKQGLLQGDAETDNAATSSHPFKPPESSLKPSIMRRIISATDIQPGAF